MAKIKLTNNELKRQKDSLKRFVRYLPTLMLKKQQLQMVVRQVESEIRSKEKEILEFRENLAQWIAVFGDRADLSPYLKIEVLSVGEGNIAGVDIPVFEEIRFATQKYDLITMPLWVDRGFEILINLLTLDAQLRILNDQRDRLGEELRITTQRVNLFEKVKIPETKENIRRIRIYLGDEQTAAVVRGKIAKRNLSAEAVS